MSTYNVPAASTTTVAATTPPPTTTTTSSPSFDSNALALFLLPRNVRIVDTRASGMPMLAAGSSGSYRATNLTISSVTLPAAARVVTGIITATGSTGGGVNATGTLSVVAAGVSSPPIITITLSTGSIGRGYFTSFVDSTTRQIRVQTSVAVHLIIDVTGFFAPIGSPDPNAGAGGLLFYPLTPRKLVSVEEKKSESLLSLKQLFLCVYHRPQ